MTTTETSRWWCGAGDPVAFARWVTDRAVGAGPHLVPVTRVGRCVRGHLAASVLHPATRSLDETLDVIGVPTEGVAVTLTVPLLQLAARARSGAIELGDVPADAVRVDEAGAVVVADRPPGASPPCPPAASPPCPPAASPPCPAGSSDGGRAEQQPDGPSRVPADAARTPDVSSRERDGPRQLVTAARAVWDRVDARSAARGALDPALDAARDGDALAVVAALDLVLAAAPPRPVRWSRVDTALFDEESAARTVVGSQRPDTDLRARVLRSVQDIVEQGVPLGADRRIPVRHVVVATVVVGGMVTAATAVLH